MFQFPGFALSLLVFNQEGFPIRTFTDQRLFAPPRNFSQLTTSFVASWSLGIPHTLLFASYPYYTRSLYSTPNLSMNFQKIHLHGFHLDGNPETIRHDPLSGITKYIT